MSSKEKICLHEREKHPSPALPSSPVEDEEEEGQTGPSQPQIQGKASSSSSSEEESESESDAESGKKRTRRSWAKDQWTLQNWASSLKSFGLCCGS